MDTSGTIFLLGIDAVNIINPSLAADAFLRQESLDPAHLDSLAKAYEEESPIRASQIRFFRDQYLGTKEQEVIHRARQNLAMLIRQTHPLTWTRVRERATQALRARQTSAAAPSATQAPTPAPPPMTRPITITLADILKKEPQVPPNFDPFNTTSEELDQLPTLADKLRTQVWIYRKTEAFALSVVQRMEGLEENDFKGLEEILREVQMWQYNILSLVQKPLKSIGEGATDLIYLLLAPLALLSEQRISWGAGLTKLRRNFNLHRVTVDGTDGYYTYEARKKYARAMATWLAKNSESGRWKDEKWELTATRRGKGFGKKWPPDPNNLRFQTYLDLLGWAVEVKPAGERVVITIDFGNWGIH